MSLVVAAIHDGDRITMVSDTKISFFDREGHADEARNRRTYFEALPKIVLLRPDLMVGVTGDDPDDAIKDLVGHRNDQPEAIADHLVKLTSAGFVVAARNPSRLWSIGGGVVDERTQVGRAWSGDRAAYDIFRQAWEKWPAGLGVPFLLTSSMQFLTSFGPVASVDGFTLVATAYDDGFRFQPWTNFVGPSRLQLDSVRVAGDAAALQAVVPPGGDPSTHLVHILPGKDPTRGALAIFIPQTGVGLLFQHARPWSAQRVRASTPGELVATVAERFGEALTESAPPPRFGFAAT
jgi:hypothetical protein